MPGGVVFVKKMEVGVGLLWRGQRDEKRVFLKDEGSRIRSVRRGEEGEEKEDVFKLHLSC